VVWFFVLSIVLVLFGVGLVNSVFFGKTYACLDCNLVIISLDTLRGDMLGYMNYSLNTTPFLDEFSKESVVFTRAFSNAPWTLPSHASMFTGLFAGTHGAIQGDSVLTNTTFTEVLANKGYATFAFSGAGFVSEATGVLNGFQTVFEDKTTIFLKPFDFPVIRDTLACKSPFFAFFHTYYPHDPYVLNNESEVVFPIFNSNLSITLAQLLSRKGIDVNTISMEEALTNVSYREISRGYVLEFNDTPREAENAKRAYANKIRKTDEYVRELFNLLEEKGCLEKTLVVVMSDHGEAFGEHGTFLHRKLYNTEIHVPLLIHFPENMHEIREEPVMLADLFPTILTSLGVSYADHVDGTDMFSAEHVSTIISGHAQETPYFKDISVIKDSYKLIITPNGTELYNIAVDFGETTNLNQSFPEVVDALRSRI